MQHSIHNAVEEKVEWLRHQPEADKLLRDFVRQCADALQVDGSSEEKRAEVSNLKKRADRVVNSPSQVLPVHKYAVTTVVTAMAYFVEGARERQLESPDEPVNKTADWWMLTIPPSHS